MKKHMLSLIVAALLSFLLTAEDFIGTALLIDNDRYSLFPDLEDSEYESRMLKDALEIRGFEVIWLTDADRETIQGGLKNFESRLKSRGGMGFFYYGGHTGQWEEKHYLIPVDADVPDEGWGGSRAVDLDQVTAALETSGQDPLIFIFHTSPDDPLSGRKRAEDGLSLMSPIPANSVTVYCPEPDGSEPKDLFLRTLAGNLNRTGHFTEVLRLIRRTVYALTKGAQTFEFRDQLSQPVYLVGNPFHQREGRYGRIQVNLAEDGSIYLNGDYMSTIRAGRRTILKDIPVGDHEIVVRYAGYLERKSVHVHEDETLQADFIGSQPAEAPADRNGMVFVQGGSFQMGSDDGDRDEAPVHKVTVSSFFIGKYEVTQGEYEALMGATSLSGHKENGDVYPVSGVTWVQAAEYCNALSRKEGLTPCYDFEKAYEVRCDFSADGYRLPTEAEWEFAARGGNISRNYPYPGADRLDSVVWYGKNSRNRLHPVGQKLPNELGLYDMAGNMEEWCWDWFGDYGPGSRRDPVHPGFPPSDPVAPEPFRVVRGGDYYADDDACGVTSRFSLHPELQTSGFRLVRRESKSGRLQVTLAETGRLILDGREIGSFNPGRPVILEDITAGDRELEVRYGNHTERRSVRVYEGRTAEAVFTWSGSTAVPVGETMVPVPGGIFTMGSGDEWSPYRTVRVSPFYMSRYEVTQAEWESLMDTSLRQQQDEAEPAGEISGEGPCHPMYYVSWYDAAAYCNALSLKEGLTPCYSGFGEDIRCDFDADGYRLPTEAEWEYAARGGDRFWEDFTTPEGKPLDDYGWYADNANGRTHPVGRKEPNVLGLYDMAGNVREWCWDWSGRDSGEQHTDPRGPSSGSSRITKGGHFRSIYRACLLTAGSADRPSNASPLAGFRMVRRQ